MEITRSTLYRCDICGKESTWDKNWSTHIFPMDISSDMYFHLCSEYCDRILLNMTKVQKKKNYLDRIKQ